MFARHGIYCYSEVLHRRHTLQSSRCCLFSQATCLVRSAGTNLPAVGLLPLPAVFLFLVSVPALLFSSKLAWITSVLCTALPNFPAHAFLWLTSVCHDQYYQSTLLYQDLSPNLSSSNSAEPVQALCVHSCLVG